MNLFFRLLWLQLAARFRGRCRVLGPVRTPFRVLPSDLDVLRHVNNGVYLSILDLARMDLMIRSGLGPRLKDHGWYPVVAAETIRFRRSLTLFQRFHVETVVLGWDEKSFYIEQHFVRNGDAIATALIAARFLRRGGTVRPADVLELAGVPPESPELPAWAARLAAAQAELPLESPLAL